MKVKDMKRLYRAAQQTKTGEDIKCPACGTSHKKTTYNKVFCSNNKTAFNSCKDKYWNTVDPNKRNRDTPWKRERDDRHDYDDDQGWDAHKDY